MDGRLVERTTIRIPIVREELIVTKPALQDLRRTLKSFLAQIDKILLDNSQ